MLPYPKIYAPFERDRETRLLDTYRWRVQELDMLQDVEWVFQEKIDGTNIRVMWSKTEPDTVRYAGRTDRAVLQPGLHERLEELFPPEVFYNAWTEKLEEPGDFDICLYGEGYGRKIQKIGSKYIPDGVDFLLFDVMINGQWCSPEVVYHIATALDVNTAPYLGTGILWDAVRWVENGFQSLVAQEPIMAEGIIARPRLPLFDRRGNRIITKIKHVDFHGKGEVA